jgi:hypothetical protein
MFVIYHVIGLKVGCTRDFQRRCLANKRKYGDHIEIEVLEEVDESVGAEVAGDLELKWSQLLGYGKPTHYKISSKNLDGAWNWKGRKGFAAASQQEAKLRRGPGFLGNSKDEHRENSLRGARKGYKTQYDRGKNPFQNSDIQSRLARRAAELGRGCMKKIVQCPHCLKKGTAAIMARWHGDRCKLKPKEG